jgi:DNA-binding transcriptional LysR family regulator
VPRRAESAHAYKETTLQQLRSFFETARLGSLSAAAEALGLSHPTVWQQVHALERDLGERLIEPHGRGCRLTDAGRVLADLAAPVVLGAASLRSRFRAARAGQRPPLVVVGTPRVLAEDLPAAVRAFLDRRPDVRLTVRELSSREAEASVAAGEADLGVLPPSSADPSRPWESNPWLEWEPAYEIDVVLVTPPDHPLARRRRVTPDDLAGLPFANAPQAFSEPGIQRLVGQLGAFEPHPCRIDAQFAATSREYVRRGFGVALVTRSPARPPDPDLHERDMSEFFGRAAACFVRRKGAPATAEADDFRAVVRESLATPPKRGKK